MAVSLPSGSTSSSLIRKAKQRDADAWRRLAALYGPLAYRWARQAGLQPSDAADVVQEVFRSVAEHIFQFHGDRPQDSFRGWLWTITRNAVRRHYRQLAAQPPAQGGSDAHRRMQQIPELAERPSAPEAIDSLSSLTHRASELVRQDFEPHTWQAFWRVTMEGQSAPDVAADLGMTPGAVRQAKYRVLARLREELADD